MASDINLYNFAKRHYRVFIATIIGIFLLNEAILFRAYQQQTVTTNIINQAGRQRMYSQKIAKLTQYYQAGDVSSIFAMQDAVDRWSITHQSFKDQNSPLSKFYFSNALIKKNYDDLSETQQAIEEAVNQIIAYPEADNSLQIEVIKSQEGRYLALMDIIVNQMEAEADEIYFRSTFLEITIGVLTFVGLTGLIFFLMVPMITDLRSREKILLETISEKNSLLSEVHHRIKNNLANLSGLFQLQLMKKEYNHSTFENAMNRVQSIAGLHEFLYKKNEYRTVSIDEHINALVKKLSETYSQLGSDIKVHVVADPVEFPMEKAVPFALLLNELVTNSIKHAFKEGDLGKIDIVLTINDQRGIYFSYEDNGSGLIVSSKKHEGIGSQLISSLTAQLESEYVISYIPSFSFSMIFDMD